MGYFKMEIIVALVLGLVAYYRHIRSTHHKNDYSPFCAPADSGTIIWLKYVFVALIIFTVVSFILKGYVQYPHGKFDAWNVWNYRARWLFRGGEHWTDAFTPAIDGGPDYPLLISASVFRMWAIFKSDHVAVPVLIAGIFTFGSIFAVFSSVAILRGKNQGYLAGLVMILATRFLNVGTYQYADVPLSFFILGTIILLCLRDQFASMASRLVFLSGLTASFAAWTKNEGMLFFVLLVLVCFVGQLVRGKWSRTLKDFSQFFLGSLPVLVTLVYFKIKFAPSNDIVSFNNLKQSGINLLDFDRYVEASTTFIKDIVTFNDGIVVLMAVYFCIAGLDRDFAKKQIIFYVTLALLLLAGYFFSYILSPHNLRWQLSSSLFRLIIHVLPLFVFLFFYSAKRPEPSYPDI